MTYDFILKIELFSLLISDLHDLYVQIVGLLFADEIFAIVEVKLSLPICRLFYWLVGYSLA